MKCCLHALLRLPSLCGELIGAAQSGQVGVGSRGIGAPARKQTARRRLPREGRWQGWLGGGDGGAMYISGPNFYRIISGKSASPSGRNPAHQLSPDHYRDLVGEIFADLLLNYCFEYFYTYTEGIKSRPPKLSDVLGGFA